MKFNINDSTVKKVIDFYNEAPFPTMKLMMIIYINNLKVIKNLDKKAKILLALIKIFLKLDVGLVNFLYIFQLVITIEFMR